MSARKLISSGSALVSMHAVVQTSALLRNVIIARLVTPADFGIAATFAMTVALLEMISNLDADKLLVQAEYGDDPRFQHSSQLLQSIRGLVSAVVLFSIAQPLSSLFGVPQAIGAFRGIALVPLIKGFAHSDPTRKQREMIFRPMIIVEVTTSIVVTAFAVSAGLWIRDYTLMLWVLLLQVSVQCLMSHLLAERRYGWAFDPQNFSRILKFGWPLLVNGVLLFIIFQGDRFVIGAAPNLFARNTYTLTDLGMYSVAFSLAMAPTTVVATVSTSLFLPLLSRVQNMRPDFERRYAVCAQIVCLSAVLIAMPLIVGGPFVVRIVYGSTYAQAGTLIGWLAAMWSLRTMRIAPSLAALSNADTRNAMMSNFARGSALVLVVFAAARGESLMWVAVSGVCGELLATAVSVKRLRRQYGLSVRSFLKPATVAVAGMVIAGLLGLGSDAGNHWPTAVALSAVLMAGVLLGMLTFSEFRRDVQAMVRPERFVAHLP